MITIYETNDALGGRYENGPLTVCEVATIREAKAKLRETPEHYAELKNGDRMYLDGGEFSIEPGLDA